MGERPPHPDVGRLRWLAGQRRLAVDDQETLLDLAAVGITKVAWRNSPIELWHSWRFRRIGQAELMRANAATTRLVRSLLAADDLDAEVFESVCDAIADRDRLLPDGRRLWEFAPTRAHFDEFTAEVGQIGRIWSGRADAHGPPALLLELACEAGRGSTRRWWLGPDWPIVVEEFFARMNDPTRSGDLAPATRPGQLEPPTNLPGSAQLSNLLLDGPDLLEPAWVGYCLTAGLGDVIPRWWDLPPAPRRARGGGRDD